MTPFFVTFREDYLAESSSELETDDPSESETEREESEDFIVPKIAARVNIECSFGILVRRWGVLSVEVAAHADVRRGLEPDIAPFYRPRGGEVAAHADVRRGLEPGIALAPWWVGGCARGCAPWPRARHLS